MNRRDFLKTIAAAVVASRLPSISTSVGQGEWITLDDVKRAVELLRRNAVEGPYVAFMHPSTYEDLMGSLTPKERWRLAYREARMELKGMAKRFTASSQIGSYNNVRFVMST